MTEQWNELKETITELRDNDGTATQQEVCKFLANYMGVLEKQMIDPIDRVLEIIDRFAEPRFYFGDCLVYHILDVDGLKDAVKALKGGEQE